MANGHGQLMMDGFDDEGPSKRRPLKFGYEFGEVTSALQKEIRRGDERAAVFWAMILHEAAPLYCWKRVLICAAEDIGMAAPETVAQVYSLAVGYQFCKTVSKWWVSPHALTMAVMLLCRAKKSTEVEDLQTLTLESIKAGQARAVPEYARDAHTQAGKEAGKTWAEWYADRVGACGIPVNAYTEELWKVHPEWHPDRASGAGTEGDDLR